MITEALLGLIFVPLLAACALVLLPRRAAFVPVALTLILLPALLALLTLGVSQAGIVAYEMAAVSAPLGIRLIADPLAIVLLWTATLVAVLAGVHAFEGFPPGSETGRRFWPLWLVLMGAINAALLSADLFNLYITLELLTVAAIALIAIEGQPDALRAAMRYLLLAVTGSLVYLFGVGLVYANHGMLDLHQLAEIAGGDASTRTALALMSVGLLVKAGIFPLHVWLPGAHGNAPGPVSAMLSAVVVKVAIYALYRIWLWTGANIEWQAAGTLLGLLGAGAILFGSLLALFQSRLKMVIAYSTVAQLGYLMLVFPLASVQAYRGVIYQVLAHGLAKAALFLAAANIMHCLGTDHLRRMSRIDADMPLQLFIFGLAGISIMALPPSGGFLAKWMLLSAAWQQQAWGWMALILAGSLLAAAYIYRVLALIFFRAKTEPARPLQDQPGRAASLSALMLAILAIAVGFLSSPILELIDSGLPPAIAPGAP
ncbi:MAG: proton-conducting transporter membrane subunit [Wenzhouxiangellaceae bacterium]|nr:proton-conducting transporter membrane subunit [Wenzhouxiangellaceae bacterium]